MSGSRLREEHASQFERTSATGPTVSMTRLIASTAIFHDFSVSISSSAVLIAALREELA
jgi:hypothetical protein